MSTEVKMFYAQVFGAEIGFPVPTNQRVIRIVFLMKTGKLFGGHKNNIEYTDVLTINDLQIMIPFPDFILLHNWYSSATFFSGLLNDMNVPKHEHFDIIDQILKVTGAAEDDVDHPKCAFACVINDVTLFPSEREVRVDSLEDAERQQPCPICKERLDHVEHIEEKGGSDSRDLILLPCSHLYHSDCLPSSLPLSEKCALCKTTESSWLQLNWPMLGAAGVFTALLAYNLWKKS